MDKKTTVHVAAEAAVLGALTLYLVNRVAALEQRVATLEREVVVVAKKESRIEQSHAAALRSLLTNGQNPTPSQPAPAHHHHHVAPPVTSPARTPPPPTGRKVTFDDETEDEDDEDLMEREFGDEEEDPPSPPPAPKKAPAKSKSRSSIRVASTPTQKNPKGKDMDDVKAKAEAMRRAAEGLE